MAKDHFKRSRAQQRRWANPKNRERMASEVDARGDVGARKRRRAIEQFHAQRWKVGR